MQRDKKLHIIAGAVIAMITAILFVIADNRPAPCIAAGFIASAVAAGVKEFTDRQHGCRFDWADLSCTMLGGAIGAQAGWLALLT